MKTILIFSLLLMFSACNPKVIAVNDVLLIRTGTSFGMCIGECQKEVTITSRQTIFSTKKRVENSSKGTLESVVGRNCQSTTSAIDWNTLSQSVDFEAFKKNPATIGCPDCADGGLEWVEIEKNKEKFRVNFEYGKDVPTFSNLLQMVRTKRENLDKTCL